MLMSKSTLSFMASAEAQFKALKGAMQKCFQQAEQSQTHIEQMIECIWKRRSETRDLSPANRVIIFVTSMAS
jgi:hypothetical protein